MRQGSSNRRNSQLWATLKDAQIANCSKHSSEVNQLHTSVSQISEAREVDKLMMLLPQFHTLNINLRGAVSGIATSPCTQPCTAEQ